MDNWVECHYCHDYDPLCILPGQNTWETTYQGCYGHEFADNDCKKNLKSGDKAEWQKILDKRAKENPHAMYGPMFGGFHDNIWAETSEGKIGEANVQSSSGPCP